MGSILGLSLIAAASMLTPYPVTVPSPERFRELMATLEVPIWERTHGAKPDGLPVRKFRLDYDTVRELERGGPTVVPGLLAVYENKTKPTQARVQALFALTAHIAGITTKPDPRVIAAVRSALSDKDPAMREGGLFSLSMHGKNSQWGVRGAVHVFRFILAPDAMKVIVPDVAARVSDPDPEVAIRAMKLLWELGQPGLGIDELFVARKRPEPEVRGQALVILGLVGTDDPRTLPAFLEALTRRDDRESYKEALGVGVYFGPRAKEAVPHLLTALTDTEQPDRSIRGGIKSISAHSLIRIGAAAKPAVPALLAYCKSTGLNAPGTDFQLQLIEFLQSIDPEAGANAQAHKKKLEDDFRLLYNRPPPPILTRPPGIPDSR